jgi:prepilin-type N-terminal cleavage/methylation domain-containing protein
MKIKRTATKNDCQQGFSLIELLVSMTLVLIILGFVAVFISTVQKEFILSASALRRSIMFRWRWMRLFESLEWREQKSPTCSGILNFVPLMPSSPIGGGTYASLQVQADWNAPDCNLNGVDENVTFSVVNGVFYIDAAKTVALTDRIGALRFKFYDPVNAQISDPVTEANQIAFVNIEIDTAGSGGAPNTISSAVQIRGR